MASPGPGGEDGPVFEQWQLELLEECRTGVLGTLAASGPPALVPVCYALSDGNIVIAIDEKPKSGRPLARLTNIERRPAVSFLVERYREDWTHLAWLRVEGEARVERGLDAPAALGELRRRYAQYAAMDLEGRPLIRIVPHRVIGWRWAGGAPSRGAR